MRKFLIVFIILSFATRGLCGDTVNPHTGNLQKITDWQEEDGDPIVYALETMKVPNGSLTDNEDSTASLDYYPTDTIHELIAGASFDFFLNDTASGVGAYFTMDPIPTGDPVSTFSDAITGDDFLIDSFITPVGQPTFTTITEGVFAFHFHASTTIGANVGTARIYYEFYKRTTLGVETLIATSEESNVLTAVNTSYSIHCVHTEVTINVTDRLVIKVYGNIETSRPADPTVSIFAEFTTATRFSVSTTIDAFDDRYVEVEGDTMTGDLTISTATGGGIYLDTTDDVIVNNSDIGHIYFSGLDSDTRIGAKIVAEASNTWGADTDDAPTEIQFFTQDDTNDSSLGVQRMVIDETGRVGIGTTIPTSRLTIGNYATSAGTFGILEDTDDGASAVTFTVPALAANVAYTLPPALGGAGDQLTDPAGNGILSWAASGAGDSISIDGVGVVDPDFVSTGDVDFVDTANTVTANINALGGNTLIVSPNSIYTTITLAMTAAAAGDTILVAEGVYDEAVTFSQNLLTLKALGSIKNTTITQATGTVVNFSTKAGCVLDGFTVNLSAATNATDEAIYSNNSDASVYNYVWNCKITADHAGGSTIALMAVHVDDGNFRMENCDVDIEQSNDHACYAFDIRGAHTHIFEDVRLTMVHNPGAAKGGRGLHSDGTKAYFRNCIVDISGDWTLAGTVYALYGAATTTYEENNNVSIVTSATGSAFALYTNDTTSYVTGNTVHATTSDTDAVWGNFAGGTNAYVTGNNVSGDGELGTGVTNLYMGGNLINGVLDADALDAHGAVDMDYGSADITDHTFVADGGTSIIDGSYQFPDANGDPTVVGEFQYDNVVAGLDDGGMVWYDDDEIRRIVDIDAGEGDFVAGDDTHVVTYNWNGGAGYFDLQAGGGGAGGATYREITFLPESAVLDDDSPPAVTIIESSGAGTPRFRVADFDSSSDEIIYFTFVIPSDYTASADVLIDYYWFANDTGPNEGVAWATQISATTEADADSMIEQSCDTALVVTEDVNETEANRLIKTSGTLDYATNMDGAVAGDTVTMRNFRDISDAADDLSSDARLHSIHLRFPRS